MSKHTNNIDDFVKNQVKGLSNIGGITSTQSVKTTARSTYESPISVIPEEGVFAKSFVKSFKEQYKPVKPAKLDTTVDIFNSVEGNEFLLDEGQYLKLKNNDFLSVDAKEYFKNYQSLYNQAVKRGDKETQQQILGQLLNDKKAYTNLAAYLEAVGDDQLYDSKVSDASFLDVNGNKIDGLSLTDFVKINNSDPKSIKKSRKLNAAGVMKSGFDVTKDGQVFFINTEAMDSEYIKDNFKLKYNFYNNIQNAKFDSTLNKQLSTPIYDTDADGNVLTNVPTNTWYNSVETTAENFAKNQFREVSDDNFASAYMTVQGLVNNGSFVLAKNITDNAAYKEFLDKDGKIKEDKLKTIVENNKQFALDIVSDYIKQEFLTSRAGVGYNKQNGRAVRKGQFITEKPDTKGDGSGGSSADKQQKQLNLFNEEMRKGGLETLLKNYAEGGEAELAEQLSNFMNDKIRIEVPIEQVTDREGKVVNNQLRLKPPGLREFTINLSKNTPTEIIQSLQYAITGDPDLLKSANIGTDRLVLNESAKNLIERLRLEKKDEEKENENK